MRLREDEHSPTNAAAVACWKCHNPWGGLVFDPGRDRFEHRLAEECVRRTK